MKAFEEVALTRKGAQVPVICVYEDFFLGTDSSDPCGRPPCHLSALILLSKIL